MASIVDMVTMIKLLILMTVAAARSWSLLIVATTYCKRFASPASPASPRLQVKKADDLLEKCAANLTKRAGSLEPLNASTRSHKSS